MTTRWTPIEVDAAAAGPDFWARYHVFRRLRHAETRPDDPITPDDVVEKEVHRDHRRQGIGRSWIPLVVEIMNRNSYSTVGFGTEEESGHAFLSWLGAEKRFTGAENRLKLADLDWAMMRRWVEEGRKRSPDTTFEVYDGPMPEELRADYAPQLSTMLNTIPMEGLEHGDEVITPETMVEWYARNEMSGRVPHVMLTREPDGVVSGITDMIYAGYNPTIVYQGFTGVRPDARGRGLGKWLKAAMAIHMHELYPAAESFTTDNASSNAPMLAINTKMGFKQYRVGSEYQISRDALAARLKELAGAT